MPFIKICVKKKQTPDLKNKQTCVSLLNWGDFNFVFSMHIKSMLVHVLRQCHLSTWSNVTFLTIFLKQTYLSFQICHIHWCNQVFFIFDIKLFKTVVAAPDTFGTLRRNHAKVSAYIGYGEYIKGLSFTKSISNDWMFYRLKYFPGNLSWMKCRIDLKIEIESLREKLNNFISIHFQYFFLLGCPPGYVGLNCTLQCPYPTYGFRCSGRCECDKDSCDFSTGCRHITTGKHIAFSHVSQQNTRKDHMALSRDKLTVVC